MLRVSEAYVSVQGEGPKVGEPTIFLRFGGCNLRCPGWPCDTQHAIDTTFRKEWIKHTPDDIVKRVNAIKRTTGARNICLTGGEPFLQRFPDLLELTGLLKLDGYRIECFSNGQLEYPDWAPSAIAFVMDWKLPGSGEHVPQGTIQLRNLNMLEEVPSHERHSVKFTIASKEDFDVAIDIYNKFVSFTHLQVFAGVVWGKLENAVLVEWMLREKLPWRLTTQVHNTIWDRDKRGI